MRSTKPQHDDIFSPGRRMGVFLPSRSMGAKFLPSRSMGVGEGDDGLPPLDNGPGLPDQQNHESKHTNTNTKYSNLEIPDHQNKEGGHQGNADDHIDEHTDVEHLGVAKGESLSHYDIDYIHLG